MRLFLLSLALIVLLGCERPPTSASKTAEVSLKEALKLLLLEARLIAVDDAAVFHSVNDLIARLDEKGHLKPFASYGRTNIFFNPGLVMWSMTEWRDYRARLAECAIILRRKDGDFVSTAFDGSFEEHNQCPVKWCE